MKTIQIVFTINSENGTQFNEELSFTDTTPQFKNILLKPTVDLYSYEIWVIKNLHTGQREELKTLIDEAASEAQNFLYVFSAATDQKYSGFECRGYMEDGQLCSIESIRNDGRLELTGMSVRLTVSVNADSERVREIKRRMSQAFDLTKLRLFYDASATPEPIGRFLSLYTLMLHYCSNGESDSQAHVDVQILQIDPTVAQFPSPKGKRYETIFTKLRNELSHKREDTRLLETHAEVRKNLVRFEKIVRAFVLDGF